MPVRLYCEVETKGSAISELMLTHAGVTRSPDRKSARLISTGHSVLLLHHHSEEHSYHKFASFSWQAVISLSKCTPGGKKVYLRATQIVDEGNFLCVEICQVMNVERMTELKYYHLAKI